MRITLKFLKLLEFNDPTFWPTTDDEENRSEAYLLLEGAENLNVKLRLPNFGQADKRGNG